jgi:NAD(P)H-dependent FMN reductase
MTIVAIVGSPREGGNTDLLVKHIIQGAQEKGANVIRFFLHDLDLRPCGACEGCRGHTDDRCIIEDDMQEIHAQLRACDGLIIGTPIYWFNMSAQTKIFMDRWYALGGPEGHALKGKRVALALAYADPDPFVSGAANAHRIFQDACRWVQAPLVGTVYGTAGEKGEIAQNTALLEQAVELGRKLVGN